MAINSFLNPLIFTDDVKLQFGDSQDLEIYHEWHSKTVLPSR